jgi:hypothetical protein
MTDEKAAQVWLAELAMLALRALDARRQYVRSRKKEDLATSRMLEQQLSEKAQAALKR